MEDDSARLDEDEGTLDRGTRNVNNDVDWQMETVSLELDNENRSACDTVVYEQELGSETSEKSQITSVQNYFTETPICIFDHVVTSPPQEKILGVENMSKKVEISIENVASAMLTSFYDKSAVNQGDVSLDVSLGAAKLECVSVSMHDESPSLTELPNIGSLSLNDDLQVKAENFSGNDENFDSISSDKLSRLFADDKFGSDYKGKAFFDVLSQGISLSNSHHLSESFVSSFLRSSEHYDAWIPKASTVQILKAVSLSSNSQYVKAEDLTIPGVIITEDLKDPVRDLARQYLGEEAANARVILTADSVTQDEEGLLKLVSLGYYRAAVNLTTRLLTAFGQGLNRNDVPSSHTPLSIQLWLIRLTLLTKLRLFNMAEAESQPFKDLDQPDLYYDFYPNLYEKRRGCMVPFALRVLLAQIHTCVGKYGEALDRLYQILNVILKMIDNLDQNLAEDGGSASHFTDSRKQESLNLWKQREEKVLLTIVNCLVAQNDYQSAYSLLDTILAKCPSAIANVRSTQGHILLQLGDVKGAKSLFNSAASARGTQPADIVTNSVEKAALAIASSNFLDGYVILKEAQTIEPNNPVVINNMAVCLLYMGKLRTACQLLENAINTNPKLYLHECVLVNICTLYDLESSRSLQKKSNVLEIVNKHSGDGFQCFCLKLPSSS